jgi:hypothetical protein
MTMTLLGAMVCWSSLSVFCHHAPGSLSQIYEPERSGGLRTKKHQAGETAEYRRCFPETLLEMIVDKAHQGIQMLGCHLAQPGTQEPIRKTAE